MIKSVYDNIVILGTGKLAFYCAKLIQKECGREVEIISYRPEEASCLLRLCTKAGIRYEQYVDKEQIKEKLQEIPGKVLIVSAFNTYIFPKNVVNDAKYTIINFHPALLPHHPGRNAEAWSIYEGDAIAGVTWHKVNEIIDTGDVLIQKSICLDEDMTSLKLMIEQQKMGIESFAYIIDDILQGREKTTKQDEMNTKIHYSYEIPNDGILDEHWSIKKISAFLRAMDYGKLCTLGVPKIKLNGQMYTWDYYFLSEGKSVKINDANKDYIIKKDNYVIVLCGLKRWG